MERKEGSFKSLLSAKMPSTSQSEMKPVGEFGTIYISLVYLRGKYEERMFQAKGSSREDLTVMSSEP